jgi:DNA-binding PadR family transcriptional regulator
VRRPANALALAVLALLYEQPMHPYEMSSTLRVRHKEESIKINYGSLYSVVESLERNGLIEARERIRDGRRPERTVYGLTPTGESSLHRWLAELIAEPSRRFTDFEAALSLLPAIPPDEIGPLLARRLASLAAETEQYEQTRSAYPSFPRIFAIEAEYQAALRGAETEFVRNLLADIVDGSFDGLEIWQRFHELKQGGGEAPLATLLAEFAHRLPPPPADS